jgi:hypothetical protein
MTEVRRRMQGAFPTNKPIARKTATKKMMAGSRTIDLWHTTMAQLLQPARNEYQTPIGKPNGRVKKVVPQLDKHCTACLTAAKKSTTTHPREVQNDKAKKEGQRLEVVCTAYSKAISHLLGQCDLPLMCSKLYGGSVRNAFRKILLGITVASSLLRYDVCSEAVYMVISYILHDCFWNMYRGMKNICCTRAKTPCISPGQNSRGCFAERNPF